jgi:hypothetical protein
MDYENLDTETLEKLTRQLKYDSGHMLDEAKRQGARIELVKVEAELETRYGLHGLVRAIRKSLGMS